MRKPFLEALHSKVLLFDGSMGALLSQRGHISDCPELFTVDQPEVIRSIHRDYLEAGAQVLITDSLATTPIKLQKKGIAHRTAELAAAAVRVAKEVVGDDAYIAFDMGSTGEFLQPVGDYTLEQFIEAYKVAALAAKEAGADFAMIETMTDIAECRAACIGAREAGLDVVASFTFDRGLRILTGGTAQCCALALHAAGAGAMGINCSGGPKDMIAPLFAMREVCPLPVVVQPNAGLPMVDHLSRTVYSYSPEDMLPYMKELVDAGAGAIGGCCGTTPEYIRAFAPLVGGTPAPAAVQGGPYIASAREYIDLQAAKDSVVAIDDLEDLYDLEPEDGCAMIDMGGVTPDEAAERVLEAQSMTQKPLILKIDDAMVLDAALRSYTGVAGVVGNDAIFNAVTPKYGFVRFE